jgi:hypothetical protein
MAENQYWYARGYFDGRSVGTVDEEIFDLLEGEARPAYKDGYDAGVTDYCYYDTEQENLGIEIDNISHIGE